MVGALCLVALLPLLSVVTAAGPLRARQNGFDNDPDKSLCIVDDVVSTGSQTDGQDPPVDGQEKSDISFNNFINFCSGKTITNGLQLDDGSCNPIPMGQIPSLANSPVSFVTFPEDNGVIKANTAFTMKIAVKNIDLGHFTNAQKTYYAAPTTLNGKGQVIGHTHAVCQKAGGLQDVGDSYTFEFFKGLNGPSTPGGAGQGFDLITVDLTAGLPEGRHRCCTITTAKNHQIFQLPRAQRMGTDDCKYFTVTADGAADAGDDQGGNQNNQAGNGQQNGGNQGQQGGNQGQQGASTTAASTTAASTSAATTSAAGTAKPPAATKPPGKQQQAKPPVKQQGNKGKGQPQRPKFGGRPQRGRRPAGRKGRGRW